MIESAARSSTCLLTGAAALRVSAAPSTASRSSTKSVSWILRSLTTCISASRNRATAASALAVFIGEVRRCARRRDADSARGANGGGGTVPLVRIRLPI